MLNFTGLCIINIHFLLDGSNETALSLTHGGFFFFNKHVFYKYKYALKIFFWSFINVW